MGRSSGRSMLARWPAQERRLKAAARLVPEGARQAEAHASIAMIGLITSPMASGSRLGLGRAGGGRHADQEGILFFQS